MLRAFGVSQGACVHQIACRSGFFYGLFDASGGDSTRACRDPRNDQLYCCGDGLTCCDQTLCVNMQSDFHHCATCGGICAQVPGATACCHGVCTNTNSGKEKTMKEETMSGAHRPARRKNEILRAAPLAGSLLLALALAPPARAATYVTVDDHPSPVTIATGETVTVRFDSKPKGYSGLTLFRDVARNGVPQPRAPTAASYGVADGSGRDLDPALGKVAMALRFDAGTPAGPYVLRVRDESVPNGQFADLPLTLVPAPAPQALSGRALVAPAGGGMGTPPPDAIVWAMSDAQTPVASADVQPDGSYTLPLPPGTYLLRAEWFGNLRSQQQIVTLAAGQQRPNVDLPLRGGQEVRGAVRDDHGQPLASVPVTAMAAGGTSFTTQSLADGSYLLALPPGQYTISARATSVAVTVADEPLDVDFPAPAPGPAPAVGTIVTVAGNGTPGLAGDGRPAVAARLYAPNGMAVDRAGNLYIADTGAARVRKVDASTGVISTVAGSATVEMLLGLSSPLPGGFAGDGGPAVAARLAGPSGLAVDGSGNLFISDLDNFGVRKVDATGIITTVAGNGQPGFSGDGGPATAAALAFPIGLAAGPYGSLYIADDFNGRVRKVSPDGTITTVAGGGKVAVTDGVMATTVQLNLPHQLALDGAGNLYIAENGHHRILKLSPAGTLSIYAGTGLRGFSGDGGPATQARISGNLTMAVDSAGNLFFGDVNRIRKVAPDGTITTIAGDGQYGFSGDGGPAKAAELGGPEGLAINAAGDLLFVDHSAIFTEGNAVPVSQSMPRIRKIVGIAAPGLVAGR